jgi:stress response protein SCP2
MEDKINMSINLSKGQKISLEKEAPGLKRVLIGLGWDVKTGDTGVDFDLDSSCFLLGENGKLVSDKHFVFYNNLSSPDGSVVHSGDNRTGAGEGDDEVVKIDLSKVPHDVKKMVFVVKRKKLGFLQRIYIVEVAKGLWITLRHLLLNLLGFSKKNRFSWPEVPRRSSPCGRGGCRSMGGSWA